MCGEKFASISICFNSLGSPPRVRGKGRLLTFLLRRSGITPACAGKRPTGQAKNGTLGDHPRVCGEKTERVLPGCIRQGSPPRVRGKVQHLVDGDGNPGITPACAGKSSPPGSSLSSHKDHPRVCGEKARALKPWHCELGSPRVCGEKSSEYVLGISVTGSPPRVRGKATVVGLLVRLLRITPACAGKSRLVRTYSDAG